MLFLIFHCNWENKTLKPASNPPQKPWFSCSILVSISCCLSASSSQSLINSIIIVRLTIRIDTFSCFRSSITSSRFSSSLQDNQQWIIFFVNSVEAYTILSSHVDTCGSWNVVFNRAIVLPLKRACSPSSKKLYFETFIFLVCNNLPRSTKMLWVKSVPWTIRKQDKVIINVTNMI